MPSFYEYAPGEIKRLPFNLRRSHLYPVNEPTFTQAVQTQMEGNHAYAYFPQKMAFTRYKNGPASKPMGSSAVSALGAEHIYTSKVQDLVDPIEQGKGIYTASQASAGIVRLPQAMETWHANPHPIAQGLPDRSRPDAGEVTAFVNMNRTPLSVGWHQSAVVPAQPPVDSAIPWNKTPLGGIMNRKSSLAGAGSGSNGWATAYWAASTVGTALGAYHGYKRHDSVWAAIGWGLLGGIFPIITVPVAFAQGFGERK